MADLSTLSDEELSQLHRQLSSPSPAAPPSLPPGGAADLSTLSDEELLQLRDRLTPPAARPPPEDVLPEHALAPEDPQTWGDRLQTFREMLGAGAADAATRGFADEVVAGVTALPALFSTPWRWQEGFDPNAAREAYSKAYDERLAENRAMNEALAERYPTATTIGEVGGALGSVASAKPGLSVAPTAIASVPAQIARGAATGAADTALYGFGSGEGLEDRLTGAAYGAIAGGLTGGALSAVAAPIAKRLSTGVVNTRQELADAARGFYKKAEDSGLTIAPSTFGKFATRVDSMMRREVAPGNPLTAGAERTSEWIQSLRDQPLTLGQVDDIRQSIAQTMKSPNGGDRDLARRMRDMLDQTMENLKPHEVISGGREGVSAIKNARALWARAKKAEVIEDVIYNAGTRDETNTVGIAQNLRQAFGSLLRNKNKMRQFSKSERAAIEKIVQKGSTPGIFRFLSRFAFRGPVSAYLGSSAGGSVGGAIGAALGGPIGAGIGAVTGPGMIAGAGQLGRMAEAARVRGLADQAGAFVRSGGSFVPNAAPGGRTLFGPDGVPTGVGSAAELALRTALGQQEQQAADWLWGP